MSADNYIGDRISGMMLLGDKYFESLNTLRPLLEEYNSELITVFEAFLAAPSTDALLPVFKLQNDTLASSSGKCYEHINKIFLIADIAFKELSVGFIPLTHGTNTYTDAIDKYHKTVFMMRRHMFMNKTEDSGLLDEAFDYMLDENISPIAISYMINNEPGEPISEAISYWNRFLELSGRKRDAQILISLQNAKEQHGS